MKYRDGQHRASLYNKMKPVLHDAVYMLDDDGITRYGEDLVNMAIAIMDSESGSITWTPLGQQMVNQGRIKARSVRGGSGISRVQ